jgi:predicted metal-dependent peptidase
MFLRNDLPEKILNSSIFLMQHYPFYFEYLLNFSFYESLNGETETIGVRFNGTRIECYYNMDFINKIEQEHLHTVMIHEVMHIICRHQNRYKNDMDFGWWSKVNDMCINHIIKSNYYNLEFPTGDLAGLFPPQIYIDEKNEINSEDLYDWFMDRNNYRFKKESDDLRNNFDCDLEDININPNMIRHVVEQISDICKTRGLVSHTENCILSILNKSEDNILKRILTGLSCLKGNRRLKSYKRNNRYGIDGLKGNLMINTIFNCIMDVSGSMSLDLIKKCLSFLLWNKGEIHLIQIDDSIKSVMLIKNIKDFRDMKISGFGGTTLQPAIDYIIENKWHKYPTVIFTDGYCDNLNMTGLNGKILGVSCGKSIPLIEKTNNYQEVMINE